MQTTHWALIAGLIVAVGMELAGAAHGWKDVATPMFVGGVLVQVGTTLKAIFTDKPNA